MPAFPTRRRIDHVVLPARDLEAQAAVYRRLGFQVGARNVHPWGTENRLVQFKDSFLELITLAGAAAPPPHGTRSFSFGAHVRDRLSAIGGGMTMLAFDSPDAQADAAWLQSAGIAEFAPFAFAREGRRPSGEPLQVAFTLAFALPAFAPHLCFFFCQQHYPQNFWNPDFQRHENSALGVSEVVLVLERPHEASHFLKVLLGGSPAFDADGVTLRTRGGLVSLRTPAAAWRIFGDDLLLERGGPARFGAIVIAVERLDAAELALRRHNVPHRRSDRRIVIPSNTAFGVLVAFEEAKQPQ